MSTTVHFNSEYLAISSNKRVLTKTQAEELSHLVENAQILEELISSENIRIEESRQNGYDKGYEDGNAKGYNDALEHIAKKLVILSKEAADARALYVHDAKELALAIVRKIAGTIGSAKTVSLLADEAIKELATKEDVILYVCSSNMKMAEAHFLSVSVNQHDIRDNAAFTEEEATNSKHAIEVSQADDIQEHGLVERNRSAGDPIPLNANCSLRIKANDNLSEYDCILETSVGKVNASLEPQLSRIKKYLQETT